MLIKINEGDAWLSVSGPFFVSIKRSDADAKEWKIWVKLTLVLDSENVSFTLFSGGEDIFPNRKIADDVVREAFENFLSWIENPGELRRYDFWSQVWGTLTMKLEGYGEES